MSRYQLAQFNVAVMKAPLVNMSVWADVKSLNACVYLSDHVQIMRRRREWFERMPEASLVLWWVPAGHRPPLEEAIGRLNMLREKGPTRAAFHFGKAFRAPDSEAAGCPSPSATNVRRRSRAPMKPLQLAACALAMFATAALRAQEDRSVYFGAFYKPVCDRMVPGFEKATAVNFAAWRAQHRKDVDALEADAKFKAGRDAALVPPPPDIAAAKTRELIGTCERVAGIFEVAAPLDARFAEPERTWATFRDALREANRDVVFTCLAGEARQTFVGQMRAMSDDQLKRLGVSIAEIRLAPRRGNFQEAVILQENGAAGTVVFVKAGENWKIGRM